MPSADPITLQWDPNPASDNVIGYTVYIGTQSGVYTQTVDVGNAPHILERIGSSDKQLIWFERSGHAITVDLEHDLLFVTVLNWLNAH